jgi:hypothetical protein
MAEGKGRSICPNNAKVESRLPPQSAAAMTLIALGGDGIGPSRDPEGIKRGQ